MPVYSDLNFKMESHPATGDVIRYVDLDAIKSSLKNILMGEPSPFSEISVGPLRNILFETITAATVASYERQCKMAILQLEPRIVLDNFFITPSPDSNEILIEVWFYAKDISPKLQQIQMTIDRIQ